MKKKKKKKETPVSRKEAYRVLLPPLIASSKLSKKKAFRKIASHLKSTF